MNRVLLVPAAFVAALLVPTTAAAKGPSSASVSGPGLDKTLTISGDGEAIANLLGNLTTEAGYFPAVFGQQPNPMLAARPSGKLGPRLTIRYVVPFEGPRPGRITQDAYPYAAGGAVTYMKPGQPIFGTTTHGGWYRAVGLKRTLVRHGLSATAPGASSGKLALVAGIGVPGALAALGAAAFVARRRHQRA